MYSVPAAELGRTLGSAMALLGGAHQDPRVRGQA